MPNISNLIKSHNMKILEEKKNHEHLPCNCRNKKECPLDEKCQIPSVVYRADIYDAQESNIYAGHTENEFKLRQRDHMKTTKDVKYKSSSELSKKFWEMKDMGRSPKIKWSILQKARPYRAGQKNCDLCVSEKLYLIKLKDENLLNKKTEFISKCRHRKKFSLGNIRGT